MATKVDIHPAKTQLSRLIERVEAGEEGVIARAGKPVARPGPFERPPAPRQPGSARGLRRVGDDFDDPMPEEFLACFICGHAAGQP